MFIEGCTLNEIKIVVVPHEISQSNESLPESINHLISNENDSSILQQSWMIRIVRQSLDQEPQTEEQIYTPFKSTQDLLTISDDNSRNPLENQEISSFCEEKRILDLEGTWKIEVSWEGNIMISNENKEPVSLLIESFGQVFIHNVDAFKVTISSPSIYVIGNASIDEFYVGYNEIKILKTPTIELTTEAVLTIHESEIEGFVNNKGIIHFQDSGFLRVDSIINGGILNFKGKFYFETAKLFWNFGGIHAKNLKMKANIFYQLFVEGFNPIIDAEKMTIETFEEMKMNTGEVSVNLMKITCLGAFENDTNIKGNDILLTLQNPSVNRGLFDFENIDLKTYNSFINQGVIHAEKSASISMNEGHCFYQENTFVTPNLTIKGNNINFKNAGNLLVNKLFIHGHLIFDNSTPLPLSLKEEIKDKKSLPSNGEDEENKQLQSSEDNQPNILASFDEVSILSQTSEWINNGLLIIKKGKINKLHNHGILESEDLTVSDLNQEGIMNVSQVKLEQNGINNGNFRVKTIDWTGNFENKGDFIISKEAIVNLENVEQKGIFYCEKMTGKINKWNEFSKSFIRSNNFLEIKETHINEGGGLELSGIVNGQNFNNENLLCLNGCILTLSNYFNSNSKSSIVLQSGTEKFDINKEFIISTMKGNSGLIAPNIQIEGSLSSNDGLIFDNVLIAKIQNLIINGDLMYRGQTAFECFQNTDFSTSEISGAISVLSPNNLVDITKPIIFNNPFQLNVQKVIQKSPIYVKMLDISAKEATFDNEVVCEKNISISSDLLNSNDLILSENESITINTREFIIKGKIVTKKAPITIKAKVLNAIESIISEHSITLQINNIKIEIKSNILAPNILIFNNEMLNKGLIQSEKILKIDSTSKISNNGEIKSNKLILSTNILNNSKKIHGANKSVFIVKEEFNDDENSDIILNNCEITLPSPNLKLKGKLILTSPKWKCFENGQFMSLLTHSFDIFETAKLILCNYDFTWNHFKNDGVFELHDGKARGTDTYYASEKSITLFFGEYEFIAPKFDEYGITRSPKGIILMCGSGVSHWGKYEVNGSIYFNIQEGVSDSDASQNITELANPIRKQNRRLLMRDTKSNKILFSKKSIEGYLYKGSERILFINGPFTNFTFSQKIEFNKVVKMDINSLDNKDTLSAYGLIIDSTKNIDNSGLINSNVSLKIEAGKVNNLENGQIAAIEDVEITSINELKNCHPTNRILSQNGDVTIYSNSNVNNKNGSIHAGGAINIYTYKNIDNTSGWMLSNDPNKKSIFFANKLIDSCEYETVMCNGITQLRPTSYPGKIIINGDCQLLCRLVLEGGVIAAGGKIFNDANEPFSFEPKAVGKYKGCFSANTAKLFLTKLISTETKFFIGPGGLDIQSDGEVNFLKSPTMNSNQNFLGDFMYSICLATHVPPPLSMFGHKNRMRSLNHNSNQTNNTFDIVKHANRFPSLFIYETDGSIRLRPPIQDDSEWISSEVVVMNDYDHSKPVKFMVSPSALQYIMNFIPPQVFGLNNVPSEALLALIQENSVKKAVNHILTQEIAIKDSFPSLTWKMIEKNGTLMAYPYIIIPNNITAKADIISQGKINISSKGNINLDKTNIISGDDVIIKSEHDVNQNGGIISSARNVIIDGLNIKHRSIKETEYTADKTGNRFGLSREELITDLPCIQAETFTEKGNVVGEGIQINVDTFKHMNGSLLFKPVVLNKLSYEWRKNSSTTEDMLMNQQTAVPSAIQAKNASFYGDTKLIGTLGNIDEFHMHANLSLESQLLTNKYSGKATKSGFFRSSTMITNGTHQDILKTQIKGKIFKDMTENISILDMRSSSLDFLKTEIKSDIKQTVMNMEHKDYAKIKTSGISFPWFSDPKPALYKSLKSMLNSNSNIDRAISSVQTIANSIHAINDASNLIVHGKSYLSNITMGLANKMATFSIGTTTEINSNESSIPVPNSMKGEILDIQNENTKFEGPVEYEKINIDTTNLDIEAPVVKNHSEQEITEKAFSFSPVSAIKSHNPGGLLPSFSYSTSKQENYASNVLAANVTADQMRVNVKGDMNIKGAQVSVRDFEGNVAGNLKVESIQDESTSKGRQESIGIQFNKIVSIGDASSAIAGNKLEKFTNKLEKSPISMVSFRHQSYNDVDKHVSTRAGIVGKEKFNLNVGGKLEKLSADVGLLEDGKVTDKGVNASEIIDEEILDYRTSEKSIFVCPVAEVVDLFGAVNEMMNIRRYAFDMLKQSGQTERESIEILNDPKSVKLMNETAETCEQINDKINTAQEKYEETMEGLKQKYREMAKTYECSNDESNTTDTKTYTNTNLLENEKSFVDTISENANSNSNDEHNYINDCSNFYATATLQDNNLHTNNNNSREITIENLQNHIKQNKESPIEIALNNYKNNASKFNFNHGLTTFVDILKDNSKIIEMELKLEPEKRVFLNQLFEDLKFANRRSLNTYEECFRGTLIFLSGCNDYYKEFKVNNPKLVSVCSTCVNFVTDVVDSISTAITTLESFPFGVGARVSIIIEANNFIGEAKDYCFEWVQNKSKKLASNVALSYEEFCKFSDTIDTFTSLIKNVSSFCGNFKTLKPKAQSCYKHLKQHMAFEIGLQSEIHASQLLNSITPSGMVINNKKTHSIQKTDLHKETLGNKAQHQNKNDKLSTNQTNSICSEIKNMILEPEKNEINQQQMKYKTEHNNEKPGNKTQHQHTKNRIPINKTQAIFDKVNNSLYELEKNETSQPQMKSIPEHNMGNKIKQQKEDKLSIDKINSICNEIKNRIFEQERTEISQQQMKSIPKHDNEKLINKTQHKNSEQKNSNIKDDCTNTENAIPLPTFNIRYSKPRKEFRKKKSEK